MVGDGVRAAVGAADGFDVGVKRGRGGDGAAVGAADGVDGGMEGEKVEGTLVVHPNPMQVMEERKVRSVEGT